MYRFVTIAAAAYLLLTVVTAMVGPIFLIDPTTQDLLHSLQPPAWVAGGHVSHLLGTDQLGRDELSRVVSGARTSLIVSMLGLALAASVGIGLGLLSGYVGGRADEILMRIVDVELAVPSVLMALTVVTILGPRVTTVIFVLAIYGWVIFARLTRGQVLALRDQDFVLALRALGASSVRIVVRHILPNALVPLVVVATLELPNLIIIEASLGYLGLGIPPPTPTWGAMISDGQTLLTTGVWWTTAVPGVAIGLFILAVNILGDWTRDRLDPRASLRR